MKISVIIPSYLGAYQGAALFRDVKLVRAINSVLEQTYQDFEIYVVADGCKKTFDIVNTIKNKEKVQCSLISKQKLWSGNVRNFGIKHCTGDVICYLDNDDYFGKDHLKIIADNFKDNDWVFFNDLYPSKTLQGYIFAERLCFPDVKGKNGTSNIAHKKSMNVLWKDSTYLHDFKFIEELKKASDKWQIIPPAQYKVCHVPRTRNFRGLDI